MHVNLVFRSCSCKVWGVVCVWEKKEWELDEVVYQNGGRLVTLTKGPNITLRFFVSLWCDTAER